MRAVKNDKTPMYQLMRRIGPRNFLFLPIFQVIESYAQRPSSPLSSYKQFVEHWENSQINSFCPTMNTPHVYKFIENTILIVVLAKSQRVREHRSYRGMSVRSPFQTLLTPFSLHVSNESVAGLSIPESCSRLNSPYRRHSQIARKLSKVQNGIKKRILQYVLSNFTGKKLQIASVRLRAQFPQFLGFFVKIRVPQCGPFDSIASVD